MLFSYLIKYSRILGALAAVAALLSGFYMVTGHYEQKGYDKAVREIQREANKKITEATQAAIEEAKTKMESALQQQRKLFDAELKNAEQQKIVETEIKEVIKHVEVVKTNCKNVGSDVIRLLNNSIDTVN